MHVASSLLAALPVTCSELVYVVNKQGRDPTTIPLNWTDELGPNRTNRTRLLRRFYQSAESDGLPIQ